MPSYRNLTVLLTLAACEHAAPSATAQEPRVDHTAPAGGQPGLGQETKPVETEAPKPAVAKQPEAPPPVTKQPAIIHPKSPTAYDYDKRCMSRAGCRWEKEAPKPRVQKVEDKP